MGEVAVVLVVVHAVADDEFVFETVADVIDVDGDDVGGGLVEKGAYAERCGVAGPEIFGEVAEGLAGIDDVFDEDDVAAGDGVVEVFEDADDAGGGIALVAGDGEEVDGEGEVEAADEVGHEDEGALEHADEDGIEGGDVTGDLGGEAADAGGEGAPAEDDGEVGGEVGWGIGGHREGRAAQEGGSESSDRRDRKNWRVQAWPRSNLVRGVRRWRSTRFSTVSLSF